MVSVADTYFVYLDFAFHELVFNYPELDEYLEPFRPHLRAISSKTKLTFEPVTIPVVFSSLLLYTETNSTKRRLKRAPLVSWSRQYPTWPGNSSGLGFMEGQDLATTEVARGICCLTDGVASGEPCHYQLKQRRNLSTILEASPYYLPLHKQISLLSRADAFLKGEVVPSLLTVSSLLTRSRSVERPLNSFPSAGTDLIVAWAATFRPLAEV